MGGGAQTLYVLVSVYKCNVSLGGHKRYMYTNMKMQCITRGTQTLSLGEHLHGGTQTLYVYQYENAMYP